MDNKALQLAETEKDLRHLRSPSMEECETAAYRRDGGERRRKHGSCRQIVEALRGCGAERERESGTTVEHIWFLWKILKIRRSFEFRVRRIRRS